MYDLRSMIPDIWMQKGLFQFQCATPHPVSQVTFLVRGGKFASGLDFSGELKKAPLIVLQHFLSPPDNKQAKLVPPWKQTSKIHAPLNFEQQNQMSNPLKNSHF